MPTLLVTGASGLLGHAVALEAWKRGWRVVGTYHQHAPSSTPFETAALTLEDARQAESLVASVAPDVVIHCAALTNVDYCEDHPEHALQVNGEGTGVLARAAEGAGASFLYVSSDGVFDGARGWYVEDDPCTPVNAYARSKAQGERETLASHPGALVARLAPFGWSPLTLRPSLAEWVLGELGAGRRIRGFTDAIFTPLYTRTLADLFLGVLDRGLRGIYHMGCRDACSKGEFADRLRQRSGFPIGMVEPASLSDHAFRARRPGNVSLATAKLVQDLGRSMPALDEEIAAFLQDAPRRPTA